jgi:dihydrofolate synthase/folylpolyglutamate synthase
VLNPLAVVITTISLEHTNVLGDTIEKISAEKAAIIKDNSKVFFGRLKEEAAKVIKQKCRETNSILFSISDFIIESDDQIRLILDKEKQLEMNPPLKGKYQKYNAALAALTVLKTFSFNEEEKYLLGIANVSKNTGLQGRYEYYHRNPTIIFDSAHNPESVENFLSEFKTETGTYKRKILIFGAMRDKAIDDMLSMLSGYFDEILISEIKYERAAKPEEIADVCNRLGMKYRFVQEPAQYIRSFLLGAKDDCLVVLGSMYLVGEIKQQLREAVA